MYPQDLCGLARLLNAEQVLANIKMQQQTKKKREDMNVNVKCFSILPQNHSERRSWEEPGNAEQTSGRN